MRRREEWGRKGEKREEKRQGSSSEVKMNYERLSSGCRVTQKKEMRWMER